VSMVVRRHSGKVGIPLHLIMLALVVSVAYSLERQASSSMEVKVIEAGLIESGSRPALYFDLRNTGKDYASYMYIVTYNTTGTETKIDRSSVTVPPGRTFGYSISLTRPSHGVMVLNLKIYGDGNSSDEAPLHNQTWIIRAQT